MGLSTKMLVAVPIWMMVVCMFQEQLGYIVFSGIRRSNGVQGLRIIVQSDRHPAYVDTRIEQFLIQMMVRNTHDVRRSLIKFDVMVDEC